MAASWLTQSHAAAALGISVRTLQRRIKRHIYDTRPSDVGQEVLVDVPELPDRHVADKNEITLAAASMGMARHQVDQAHVELTRARRIGIAGWTLVFVLLAGGIGATWKGARTISTAEAKAQNAAQRAETLQADLSIARTEKDAVRVSLATITDALQEQTAATREKSAEVLTLRAELAQARTTAGRATWFRQVLGAFYQAGQVTTRPSQ